MITTSKYREINLTIIANGICCPLLCYTFYEQNSLVKSVRANDWLDELAIIVIYYVC